MKKYRVSDSELFNLNAMREHLMCELWAMEDGGEAGRLQHL